MRRHGFPKNGIVALKADLFSVGGEIFNQGRASVFVAPDLNSQFSEVALVSPCAPFGGKWGQAKGILFYFRENEAPAIPSLVALPRVELPKLPEGEFYVADVMSFEVTDGRGKSYGNIVGFLDVAPNLGGAVNLRAKTASGKEFEFPASWVERLDNERCILVVPEVEVWASLKEEKGDRDDD